MVMVGTSQAGASGVVTSQTGAGGRAAGQPRAGAGGVVTMVVTLAVVASDSILSLGEHALWLALETILSLLTTSQDTASLLELSHGNSWKSRSRVVGSSVVVNLVDWNNCVGDVWLNSLLPVSYTHLTLPTIYSV